MDGEKLLSISHHFFMQKQNHAVSGDQLVPHLLLPAFPVAMVATAFSNVSVSIPATPDS